MTTVSNAIAKDAGGTGPDWKALHPDQTARAIQAATEEVFITMLGLEVTAGERVAELPAPGPTNGIVALIELTGSRIGTVTISCSPKTACRFSSRLLRTECGSVDEGVLDAMAEITNMIMGGFKTRVEAELGPMTLCIPTVVYGRNFTARTTGENDWTVIPFRCGEDHFDIHIRLGLD